MNERWNDEKACWFVLRCQTKREHIASKILSEVEGVETFCPRIKFKKATRRGKIWWVEPLFPGYLLAKFFYPESYRQVTSSHGVSTVVSFGERVPHLSDALVEELRALTQTHSDDEEVIEFTPTVAAGDEIEISEGPFRGFTGVVEEPLPGKERVKVLIDFLGEEQLVDVDLFSLLLPKRPTPKDELKKG